MLLYIHERQDPVSTDAKGNLGRVLQRTPWNIREQWENNREVPKGKIRAPARIRERTIRKTKEERLRTIGYPGIRRWAERTGIWALCRDSGHQGPVQKQRRAPGREWKGAHDGASKARDGASRWHIKATWQALTDRR